MPNKTLTPLSAEAADAFWAKVKKGRGRQCWMWIGGKTDKGYGFCYPYGAKGGRYRAHRVAFFLKTGVDPGEFGAVHSCDCRPCCNPGHIIPSTQKINLANMRAKGRDYRFPVKTGESAPHAILTDAEVALIREIGGTKDERGYWSERRLAARFGVAHSQVHRILSGESRAASIASIAIEG